MNFDNLTYEQKDALIAERVMWFKLEHHYQEDSNGEITNKLYYTDQDSGVFYDWEPSYDLNHCYLVESKLDGMGLQEKYIDILDDMFGYARSVPLPDSPEELEEFLKMAKLDRFNEVHASPKQKVDAVIKMIKDRIIL